MTVRLTRRTLLSVISSVASATAQKSLAPKALPQSGEFFRFLDEITETPVTRLTSLNSNNLLPAATKRAVSLKGRFLVFSSDREGSFSPFRLDLRNGQVSQLLSTTGLDTTSLTLDASARVLTFLDGHTLKQLTLSSKRMQIVGDNISQYSAGVSAAELLFIRDGGLYGGAGGRLLARDVECCGWRPGGTGCLFLRIGGELCYSALRAGSQPISLAKGPISEPCWSPDGRSVFFLRERHICEVVPESPGEKRLGGASQIASFSPNSDSSVFVGAVRSNAQPTVNLLLRNPAREFTLCEHKASNPEACQPVFSADSRRIYFNTDFQGKSAIYSVNVETLIEETSER